MKAALAALLCLMVTFAHAAAEKKPEYTPEEQASIDKQYEKAMADWNNEALRRDAGGMVILSTMFTHDEDIIQAIVKRYNTYDISKYREMNGRIRSMNHVADKHIDGNKGDCSAFTNCWFWPCILLSSDSWGLLIDIENYLVHGADYANAEEGWKKARKDFDRHRSVCKKRAYHQPKKSDFKPETDLVTI